ncbi:protoporphyrinogen oxidase [Halovenus salina]|uniref:Protoporphyrinogen oxidase n=1 Tax=Halovenus salina TaxID=1510225 RepID=A0ABD5W4F8_9EURY|nr:protoporphyrinogen oxidase [Halovenus salina]
MTETRHTVGIVGAGITGLALTHHLAERGVDSVTLEASDEPGGVIDSREVDGHILEVGPQRMRKTPGVADLAEVAGVGDAFIEAKEEELYVYADGDLGRAPLSVSAFFGTDLLSWRGKLRMATEPLTREGRPEETAGELFVRKFGREAYEKFIGPLYGGIYGSDPMEMPAAFALEGLLQREQEAGSLLQAFRQRVGNGHTAPPVSFEGGNQRLPRALAETYSDRVELETPVTGIDPLDSDVVAPGEEGGPYRLTTPDDRYVVDHLVVTTPAMAAGNLLSGLGDGVDDLDELRYNELAMAFLSADHDHTGKGYQVGYGEDVHTLGVSWNDQMFGREGVQTAFLGGMHDPNILDESDERLGEIACNEFEEAVGVPASVITIERLDPGFPAWDNSWWLLEDLELPADVTMATNYTARMGIPSRVREAREVAEAVAAAAEETSPQTSKRSGTAAADD